MLVEKMFLLVWFNFVLELLLGKARAASTMATSRTLLAIANGGIVTYQITPVTRIGFSALRHALHDTRGRPCRPTKQDGQSRTTTCGVVLHFSSLSIRLLTGRCLPIYLTRANARIADFRSLLQRTD